MRVPGELSRREWLALVGASGVSSLAGCNSQNNATRTSPATTNDPSGGTTQTQDTNALDVAEFSAVTTSSANQIGYRIQLAAADGEVTAELATPAATATRTIPSGEQQLAGELEAPAGDVVVAGVLRDAAGNETSVEDAGYARRNAVVTDGSHTLGATYHPGIGGDWQECITGAPAIGEYGRPPEPAVVDAQTDQAQGIGITRWIVNIAHPAHLEGAEVLSTGALGGEIPLEFDLNIDATLDRPTSFEGFLGSVQDAIERAPAYQRRAGRPVVALSGVAAFDDADGGWQPHPQITTQFQSPIAFIETVRESLGGDTDPYLVGELGIHGMLDYESNMTAAYRSFTQAFDALYEVPWNPGEGAFEWATAFSRTFDRFWAARLFADDVGIEFEPAVFPGWNHTINTCTESTEHIPRSPSHLTEMLEAADLLGTTDRIRVHSFNDWRNGTQIEPGAMQGTDYGHQYLDVIESFQTSETNRSLYGRADYYVSPDGADTNLGSERDPLRTIQQAVSRARAGTTIHVQPGTYTNRVSTVRGGTPENPITITGPREAVFNANGPFEINHSHVHLRGLTFDGLHTPSAPDDIDSYSESILQVNESLYETGSGESPEGV